MAAIPGSGLGRSNHGTESKYRAGCRCDDCRTAGSAAAKERRAKWAAAPSAVPAEAHGTNRGYVYYSCRCDDCRAFIGAKRKAERDDMRALRERYSSKAKASGGLA